MYKNKKTGLLGSGIVLLILIVLVFTTSININNFSKIENIINKMVMPIQYGFTNLKNKIAKNEYYFSDLENLKKENAELKNENEKLKTQIEEVEILKAENSVLRSISELSEHYLEYKTIGAYVIGKNISNLSDVFVINVGTEDGVYSNMAVMGKDGLVGHIISATKHTAKVQPIIDFTSSVSGKMKSSNKNVIVKGQVDSNKFLRVDLLQPDTDFLVGDIIETSGLGGIYPKGIKIGSIKEVIEVKNTIEKYAILETMVDFEDLEYVLVIKNSD